jgi:hypothetical protein
MPSWEGAIFYLVDRSNVILDAGDGWDEAAVQADGGLRALRTQIIGKPLESFIVGDATRMFVRACLDSARHKKSTRVLPYRCDSATDHRSFEMIITPLDQGHVRVEHALTEARLRARRSPLRQKLNHSDVGSQRLGWRCSQCLCVRLLGQDDWRPLPLEPQQKLAQDVCPDCAQRLFDTELPGLRKDDAR